MSLARLPLPIQQKIYKELYDKTMEQLLRKTKHVYRELDKPDGVMRFNPALYDSSRKIWSGISNKSTSNCQYPGKWHYCAFKYEWME